MKSVQVDNNTSPQPIQQSHFDIIDSENKVCNLPLLTDEPKKTDLTDITDPPISNTQFLTGIFGKELGTERPIVVSFVGNPNKVSKHSWSGKPWVINKTSLPDSHNNYTSFAIFKPDKEDKYHRQKKLFTGLYAVMLDDIGTLPPMSSSITA